MEKDPLVYTDDILEAIGNIEAYTEGYNFEIFNKSRLVRQGVERNLEIISEASRRIPDTLKEDEKEIPWKKVANIGNVLRHEYGEIDYDRLWDVCENHLPPLKEAVLRMQQKLEGKH